METINLETLIGFEWDHGNIDKNKVKHNVSSFECEQCFFNIPLLLHNDHKHSEQENRFYILGKTDNERKLYIVFTVRNQYIRIISARDMNKKERETYEKAKTITKI